ncbi:MAG: ATP-binding cassette domain-containing protein [Actinobacteria bacterium]|nr:ATP-binding cassette domain-containing protein [Actinomycetota bacterium]
MGGSEAPGFAIEVRGLWVRLGRLDVLRDVTLAVARGERVGLVGPNGAGKTTLLRALATLLSYDRGTVRVAGYDLPRDGQAARAAIGYAGHRPHLYEHLTARENLRFFARLYGVADAEARADAALAAVALTHVAGGRAGAFSRGMQQRLALAAAMAHAPDVLLLDEPDAGLDATSVAHLPDAIATLCPHATVLFSTHDRAVAQALGARVVELRGGVVAKDASSAERVASQAQAPAGRGSEPPSPAHQAGGQVVVSPPGRGDGGQVAPLPAQHAQGQVVPSPPGRGETPAVAWSGEVERRPLGFFAAASALIEKDLRVEWRAREQFPTLLVFTLLLALVFDMAFVIPAADAAAVAAGTLWGSLLLGSTLAGIRLFAAEHDRGTLAGLLLAPVDPSAVFLGKFALLVAQSAVVGMVQLTVLSVLLNVPLLNAAMLAALGLAAVAMGAIVAMQSALIVSARARELLMPLLALPLAVPVLLASIGATHAALGLTPAGTNLPWIGLLAVSAAVFLSLAVVLYPHTVHT